MKAIALLSGGLDSTLAVKLVLEQGIDVVAVNYVTPFCQCSRKGCRHEAKKAADDFGIKLKAFNISGDFLEVVKNPKHGYGRNLNPCIDCRIMMHRKAKEYMEETGASFLITGEVLGQRPMSQHRKALELIERESGVEGLVLRPLSAKLFAPTIPETTGVVDRERLLDFNGRSRKPQIALAEKLGVNDYPCPAGGCLLTDAGFARRMRDLMEHGELSVEEIPLLKVGRHFRLSPSAKLVVGRDEGENERLLSLAGEGDICFDPLEVMGPIGIGRGFFDQEHLSLGSQVIARYCSDHEDGTLEIGHRIWPDEKATSMTSRSMAEAQLQEFRI
ncbi:MAG: hypothetical protein KAR36_05510 [Candidatus Latescibacteria bacterium]|nr:hypothetical protein [Candidatus Latescibacterota bacterium]